MNAAILDQIISESKMYTKYEKEDFTFYTYNYFDFVEYGKLLQKYPFISEIRGLMIHESGRIIYSMPKFFNPHEPYNEYDPNLPCDIYEKIDGSLIKMFVIDGKLVFATKNGFSQEFITKAHAIYDTNQLFHDLRDYITKHNYVALLELVRVDNPIVIQYNEDKLFLLALRDEVGNFIPIPNKFQELTPRKFDVTHNEALTLLDTLTDAEGFVVYQQGRPVQKLKTRWYIERHVIYSQSLAKLRELVITQKIDDVWDIMPPGKKQTCIEINNEWANLINTLSERAKPYEHITDPRIIASLNVDKITKAYLFNHLRYDINPADYLKKFVMPNNTFNNKKYNQVLTHLKEVIS